MDGSSFTSGCAYYNSISFKHRLALSELIAFGLLYKIDTTMKQADYIRLTAHIAVLKEIAVDYSGKTIDNIIQQLEAIKKDVTDED